MTISVTTLNVSKKDQRGPDRSQLPDVSANVDVIDTDTESKVINIKGLHAVGIVLPSTTDIAGLTDVEIHVSNLEDGTFALLAQEGSFALGAAKSAVGSGFLVEWNYMKLVYVGTITGSGEIPLSFA